MAASLNRTASAIRKGAALCCLAAVLAPVTVSARDAQADAPRWLRTAAAATDAGRIGEKVMAYVSGSPYPGTIVGVGSGSMAGYYLIHFDNARGPDSYAKAEYVVPRSAGAAPASGKPGKIHCVIGTIGGKPVCLPTATPVDGTRPDFPASPRECIREIDAKLCAS